MKKVCAVLLAVMLFAISAVCVSAEIPELPENNRLISDEWVRGLGSAKVKKEDVDGEEVYTISNFDSTYASPYLDLYPTVKEMIGDESEISIWIVLDVRVINTEENVGEAFPFGMKLRPATTALTKSEAAFNENYGSEADSFKHQWGSVSASLISDMSATEEWTRVEMLKTFIDFDINDEFWTRWNLCFDQMLNFENGASLQVKNVSVFLEDDYEPAEEEDENDEIVISATPAPVDVYKPINFDKYDITFADALESENKDIQEDIQENIQEDNSEQRNILPAVLIAVGAAVVLSLVVSVIVIKKKNNKEQK